MIKLKFRRTRYGSTYMAITEKVAMVLNSSPLVFSLLRSDLREMGFTNSITGPHQCPVPPYDVLSVEYRIYVG